MPPRDPISALLDDLAGDLALEKLETLARQFSELAQDRAETLTFFVLQCVCQRLAAALEGEAVSVERFEELTAGIRDQIVDILRDVQHEDSDFSKLEHLVGSLYRNLGLVSSMTAVARDASHRGK